MPIDESLTFLPVNIAVLTVSDTRDEESDTSGHVLAERITGAGHELADKTIVRDDVAQIREQIKAWVASGSVDAIITTGGTGFSPRDITPEATLAVADRNAPGIAEAMRYHSLSITPRGMLSRAASVLRGKTLIVNLPGSPKAVKENLEYILPSLEHGVRIAAGLDGECARK